MHFVNVLVLLTLSGLPVFSSCASPLTDVCNIPAALDEHQLQLKLPVDMLIPTEAIFLLPRVNMQKPIHHSTNSYEMQPRNKSPCYGVVSFLESLQHHQTSL